MAGAGVVCFRRLAGQIGCKALPVSVVWLPFVGWHVFNVSAVWLLWVCWLGVPVSAV